MSETLKDYRPQHDADCEVGKCANCGHWAQDYDQHGYGKPCDDFALSPCSCGLDALLSAPAEKERIRQAVQELYDEAHDEATSGNGFAAERCSCYENVLDVIGRSAPDAVRETPPEKGTHGRECEHRQKSQFNKGPWRCDRCGPLAIRSGYCCHSTGAPPEIAPYLKDGESPAECVARNRREVDGLLTLLAKEKARNEALAQGTAWPEDFKQRLWAKLTPALNTGTAMDLLVLVSETLREMTAPPTEADR